jgi:hypothetical protein
MYISILSDLSITPPSTPLLNLFKSFSIFYNFLDADNEKSLDMLFYKSQRRLELVVTVRCVCYLLSYSGNTNEQTYNNNFSVTFYYSITSE